MSFVNLMGDVIWSDVDITNKTENMVREYFSDTEREILTRKMVGSIAGQWVLTSEEGAAITHFGQVAAIAHQAGVDARADNVLLQKALDHESSVTTSTDPAVMGLVEERFAFKNPVIESEGGNDTP